MTELVGNWLHFSARQPKRKRAEAVCFFCHSKKIKCDLQVSLPARFGRGCAGQHADCVQEPDSARAGEML
jgi:hypothetical protein